jgi:hypothetical protein
MVVASAGWAMVICVGWAGTSGAGTVSNRATRQAENGISSIQGEGIAVGRAIL